MTEAAPTGERALADHDADGDDDVSLLLGLSEEVLVHLVKIARFTLTDVGHLRATCTALRAFFDRIRDTVNEYVAGDLTKYRPYGYWDIDRAAQCGHFELVHLLHEDEVKHGRVSHCTNAALVGANRHGNWDAFVFLVRNRVHDVFPPTDGDSTSFYDSMDFNGMVWPWKDLSRVQVLFLLDEAPGYLVGNAASHAVQGPILRGEMDLVARLLPLVRDRSLLVPLRFSFAHCRESMDGFKAVLAECRRRSVDAVDVASEIYTVAAKSVGCGAELVNLALEYSPVALADMPERKSRTYANMATDAAVIARLRELGLKRRRANAAASVDDIVYSIKQERASCTPDVLVRLLLAGDYETATCAARTMKGEDFHDVARQLADATAVDALKWMKAQNLLAIPYEDFIFVPGNPSMALAAWVDFAWPLALDLAKPSTWSVSSMAMSQWGSHAAEVGDVALLRRLCALIDVVRVSAGDAGPFAFANGAAMGGHWNVLAFMIDVNARIVPVKDSEAARRPGAFDLHSRPFDLRRALEFAVRGGHVHLARMLDRRVPGLKASLAAACASRRWSAFRFALGRLDARERTQQCSDALIEVVREGRIDFVRWFEANEPSVVEACIPRLWNALVRGRDMSFWQNVLTNHPHVLPAGETLHVMQYDAYLLEHRLGVCFTPRPMFMHVMCDERARGALQAMIDFRVPVTPHSAYGLAALHKSAPSLWQWLTTRLDAGAFVIVPDPF